MILSPGILALYMAAAMVLVLVLAGAAFGVRILRRWDLTSGSEEQLSLERSTYLVSTLLAYACAFELGSLALFVYSAEDSHTLFTGAMCASGTLSVNPFGYPALIAKLCGFVAAALWLILNHADDRSPLYPLTRAKYALLMAMSPVVAADAVLTALYLINLRADVITSCCGALFSTARESGEHVIALLKIGPANIAWASLAVLGAALAAAGTVILKGRGALALGAASALAIPAGISAAIVCVSPYVYELPSHHCPFCMLKGEYHYVGYFFYAALLTGAVAGMGAGMLSMFYKRSGLSTILPTLVRRLAIVAAAGLITAALISAYSILYSGLTIK